MSGLETVAQKKTRSQPEVVELNMLIFSLGVTRMDQIRNEYIRWTAQDLQFGKKVLEWKLKWFGHVQRRETWYIKQGELNMDLPCRRERGRAQERFLDKERTCRGDRGQRRILKIG